MLSGVIGGIGEYLGLTPDVITIIRIIYAVITIGGIGSPILFYIIAAIIIPSAPRHVSQKKQDFSSYSQWSGNNTSKTQTRKDVTPFDDDDDWSQF
ncbi:hypothetical protein Hs30E_11170 [Lactococcus hodotermopsidis]|uniref:Phage shock protein PspC N-terminal domain-containing protein n=2 Tax=Pseudolactococcus hodotermopsidis TaxID=2709157 RepID=A0A6A0BCJ7_9LACT|nr:hypothetical protein Hs30E_11170 [Lactococcus hodotermopsidis]